MPADIVPRPSPPTAVCNCNHGWAEHKQVELEKSSSSSIAGLLEEAAADVNAWSTVQRGGAADD